MKDGIELERRAAELRKAEDMAKRQTAPGTITWRSGFYQSTLPFTANPTPYVVYEGTGTPGPTFDNTTGRTDD